MSVAISYVCIYDITTLDRLLQNKTGLYLCRNDKRVNERTKKFARKYSACYTGVVT